MDQNFFRTLAISKSFSIYDKHLFLNGSTYSPVNQLLNFSYVHIRLAHQFRLNVYTTDVPCLKMFLSKLLSFGVVAGSLVYKLPQILKIQNSRSAKGVALLAVLLELISYSSAALVRSRRVNGG